jgi:PA domain
VNGTVQPVGGIIIPLTPEPSSSSGCTSADFTGFVPGNIALIQRGSCNFGVKIQNAQTAKASGVIIFNEGNTNPDRTGLQGISIIDAAGNPFVPTIPVGSVTFAIGKQLYDDYHAGHAAVVSINIITSSSHLSGRTRSPSTTSGSRRAVCSPVRTAA